MNGLIHIYTGDGKGKTSAATGLAVRFAGSGKKVLFCQFLKNDTSSEIGVLKTIPNIQTLHCQQTFGFVWNMSQQEKQEAAQAYETLLCTAFEKSAKDEIGLLVLDEVIPLCNTGLVKQEVLQNLINNKPRWQELVLTGRDPSERLCELADYISEIRCVKHPFQQGVPARKGIEF